MNPGADSEPEHPPVESPMHRTTRGSTFIASAAAGVGSLALVGSMFLPWFTVTPRSAPGFPVSMYAWASPINLILPLVFLPAVALVVSTRRSRRRHMRLSSDAIMIASFGVAATTFYAFLFSLASTLSFGRAGVVLLTPSTGCALALAGSLVTLSGVVAGRTLERGRAA